MRAEGQASHTGLRRLATSSAVLGVVLALTTACAASIPPAPPPLSTAPATPTPSTDPEAGWAPASPPQGPTLVASPDRIGGRPLNTALEALAAEASTAGATLVLPVGVHTLGASAFLPAGTDLYLEPGATLTGDLPGRPLVRLSGDSSLRGGRLQNTAATDAVDVDLAQGSRAVTVGGVDFAGGAGNAVYLASSGLRDITIEGSRFTDLVYGVLLNPGAIDAVGLAVRDNVFRDVCGDAIEINGVTEGTDRRVRDVTITGNDVARPCGTGDSAGFGVGMAGVAGFTVAGNTIRDARTEAVHLEDGTTDGRVIDNVIVGGGDTERPAIAIYRTTSAVRIEGNRISDYGGSGIAVRWDSEGSASDIVVRGNRLADIAGDGIVVAGDTGTGPFTVDRNVLTSIGGHGVSVLGSHERSAVTGNTIRGTALQPIVQGPRGTGVTVLEGNDVG